MSVQISSIKELQTPHVKIKNINRVTELLCMIRKGGFDNLQVVSDFDYTLTKQNLDNGKQMLSSFGIFQQCKGIPEEYLKEGSRLYHKYRPIEVDPKIPIEEKVKYMVEWWSLSKELLRGWELPPHAIDNVASKYNKSLRDGAEDMLQLLSDNNVPVLVFSAGLGDAVLAVLKACGVYHPNVKVISNFLNYKDGMLDGMKGTMIHTFNKNETALKGTEYYDLVKERGNVILMGDSLGDSGMADGIPHSAAVLKIGFLYDHVEHNLPAYMDTFDIVLIDDETMDVPRAILSLLQ